MKNFWLKNHILCLCLMLPGIFLFFSPGCAGLESEYVYIAPHVDKKTEDEPVEGMTADSLQAFKSILIRLVEGREEQGTIRLETYSSDIKNDISTALMGITKSDPLGAYAVEYMSFDYTKILNYYEITVYITYRRSAYEIEAVRQVESKSEFEELLIETVSQFGTKLAVRLPYYHADMYDVQALIRAENVSYPLSLTFVPKAEMSVYPESGLERILELRFEYDSSETVLKRKAGELKARAEEIVGETEGLSDAEALEHFFSLLREEVEFLPDREDDLSFAYQKDESFTAYGALVSRRAVSEGYALAFQALCRERGIWSVVVSGRYAGLSHMWNIVKVDDLYYHIDASLVTEEREEGFFLLSDREMEEGHHWNRSLYPECTEEGE